MATRNDEMHRTEKYGTDGNVAYSRAYSNTAPSREERQRRRSRTYQRPQEQSRRKVQVREAGQVAPFAVVGFLAVAIMALLLMASMAQVTVESTQLSHLRHEAQTLDAENASLTAQYEKVFDMESIESAVGGTMVRPTGDQIDYIDLSSPDEVVRYEQEEGVLVSMFREISTFMDGVVEYFR